MATDPLAAKGLQQKVANAVKSSLLLILMGLLVELGVMLKITPNSFVAFAALAVPLILVGMLMFVISIRRIRHEVQADEREPERT